MFQVEFDVVDGQISEEGDAALASTAVDRGEVEVAI